MIRSGVVGCGRMGAQPSTRAAGQLPEGWLPISHIEALRAAEGIELCALSDTDPQVLERWGAHYGVRHLFTDHRELIDSIQPHLLTIATRTPPKAEIIRYACARGVRGIYVEKPLATSIADCESILAVLQGSGVKLAYGVNRRYHPVYRAARQLIRDGAVGEVVEVVVEHGRSPLLWTHPHSVDLMLFFAGATELVGVQANLAPESVNRAGRAFIDSDPLVESAFFRFGSGCTGSIVRSAGLNVRIGGTSGNLVVHANGSFIQLDARSSADSPYYLDRRAVRPPAEPGATVAAIGELASAIATSGDPGISPAEIALGTRMLLGCVWSHINGGAFVDGRDIPEDLVVSGRSGNLYA